ncbi:hypothetical protein B0F90DRAFT_679991 [Multifurca ochricompacta]|uniref:Uncharacterized protein n=1 Tax=Multifurca ochricompacta TaxID=376703 RepID=A0AAD4M1E5_9AGAM|nr:hypothetical protein B0F90DRAFT_679991 [Multifurca ochricompacta]
MGTEDQSAPSAPELTVLNRVASTPLVNDSLSAVRASLVSNPRTHSPYNTAQALSSTALRYSEPITTKLAPIIARANDDANKGLDAVESRNPDQILGSSNSQPQELQDSSAPVSVNRSLFIPFV